MTVTVLSPIRRESTYPEAFSVAIVPHFRCFPVGA